MKNPIKEILKELIKETEAEGAVMVSKDGLSIASELAFGKEEDKLAAMSATVLSLANKFSMELEKGSLEQVIIKGEKGYILFHSISDYATLGLIVSYNTRLGMLFVQIKNASDKIRKLM